MSRKGKMAITLPKGVEVQVEKSQVKVKGPKGNLEQWIPQEISIVVEGDQLQVLVDEKAEGASRLHGLYQSLVQNLVVGCSQGFEKVLKMIGVGYRAAVKGSQLDLQVGNSHPTLLDIPEGVTVTVEKNSTVIISGTDKQKVGQFAANVRAKKPPEPFQGKGIRYENEYVRRKAGKTAAK